MTRNSCSAGMTSGSPRRVRGRVDVLARDLPFDDRKDVYAVPFELLAFLRRVRGPLADDEVVRDAQAPAGEAKRRPALEDAADVLAHLRGPLDALAGRPVVEDDLVVMQRSDGVEVLTVPGVVVGVDQGAQVAHDSI